MKKKEIANSPWTIVATIVSVLGTGGTIGGMIGYDHLMEKFWHPVNERMDKVIVQQKVLIYLGHTEDEISEAWHKASVEFYEERVEQNVEKLNIGRSP